MPTTGSSRAKSRASRERERESRPRYLLKRIKAKTDHPLGFQKRKKSVKVKLNEIGEVFKGLVGQLVPPSDQQVHLFLCVSFVFVCHSKKRPLHTHIQLTAQKTITSL